MYKIFLCFLLAGFVACNSGQGSKNKENSSSDYSAKTRPPGWSLNDEMEFMDACVEVSAQSLGEEKAFNQCKCILRQIQQKNPSNDSARALSILSDTTQMRAMAANCDD